jgi:hypothetical protein
LLVLSLTPLLLLSLLLSGVTQHTLARIVSLDVLRMYPNEDVHVHPPIYSLILILFFQHVPPSTAATSTDEVEEERVACRNMQDLPQRQQVGRHITCSACITLNSSAAFNRMMFLSII